MALLFKNFAERIWWTSLVPLFSFHFFLTLLCVLSKILHQNCWIILSLCSRLLLFQCISAYSGHYKPTDEILNSFLSFLEENGVNLNEVEVNLSQLWSQQLLYLSQFGWIAMSLWRQSRIFHLCHFWVIYLSSVTITHPTIAAYTIYCIACDERTSNCCT